MKTTPLILGALLLAAPDFSQGPDPLINKGELHWFALTESPHQVAGLLGQPAAVANFGKDFLSWQYQIGAIDHHEFSHQLVFRGGALISITRNYEPERKVDDLFPASRTLAYHYEEASRRVFSVRVQRLSQGRLLIAMGVSRPDQTTSQLVLIRETDVRYFYPWLGEQLRMSGR